MTDGQQPGYHGPPTGYYPAMSPVPSGPQRGGSNKTVIAIVAVAAVLVVAIVAVIGATLVTRENTNGGEPSSSSSAAAHASVTTAAVADRYRLRGSLTSKASVCAASALTSQQVPKFETPLNYSRPTLDADIDTTRAGLARLASRVSPNAVSPLRETVQDWIVAFVDVLDAYSRRDSASDVKWKGDLVDDLAGQINDLCKRP